MTNQAEHAFPKTNGDTGMTMREYAAIALAVPDSGTEWIDDMIRENRTFMVMALVYSSLCTAAIRNNHGIEDNYSMIYQMAATITAMLCPTE